MSSLKIKSTVPVTFVRSFVRRPPHTRKTDETKKYAMIEKQQQQQKTGATKLFQWILTER